MKKKPVDLREAASVMVSVEPKWTNLTQYCIRGLMEKFNLSDSQACKLYRKVLASGLIIQKNEDRDSSGDRHDRWGSRSFGKTRTTYFWWEWLPTTRDKEQ